MLLNGIKLLGYFGCFVAAFMQPDKTLSVVAGMVLGSCLCSIIDYIDKMIKKSRC